MHLNFKGILYYLSLFCFPISLLAFFNILFSSYFNYFLNLNSYIVTLVSSLLVGFFLYFVGRKTNKKIEFQEQLILVVLIYFIISLFIALPYFLSSYQISFIDSLFESISGITGTGFSIFEDIKYLDPTLILWRSLSQWIGGLYFLIFLILFFSNSQYNFKLNNLVFSSHKSFNLETNIKKLFLYILFLYLTISLLIFVIFSMSGIRLFNGLNLTFTIISAGGFLPTNSLNEIIKTNLQEILLMFSFLVSLLNIFFFNNLFIKKNFTKEHYEDFFIIFFIVVFSLILLVPFYGISLNSALINVLTSMNTSGITLYKSGGNLSLFLLFLTIIGGSIISNTSGIKLLRIYILIKGTFSEMIKLVKPNNVVSQNILFSEKKISNDYIKNSFFIFICFFLSLFILSSLLLTDEISFEDSIKLSILTLTNTTNSNIYGLTNIDFGNLLISTKISIIIFMIVGKIELISFFLIFKKFFLKN